MTRGRLLCFLTLIGFIFANSGNAVRDASANDVAFRDQIGRKMLRDAGRNFGSSDQSEKKDACPYQRRELCLIHSLSKISNVQFATLGFDSMDSSTRIDPRKNTGNREIGGKANAHRRSSDIKRVDGMEDSSGKHSQPPNVRCWAVRDVFIPEIKQTLPTFACKFGQRKFELSSARFLQDRRSRLDVNVDETTFQKIGNEFDLIPATLSLGAGDENYKIRTYSTN